MYLLGDLVGQGLAPPPLWRSASRLDHPAEMTSLFEYPYEEVNIAYVAMVS